MALRYLYNLLMRISADTDADALYVRFSERAIEETSQVRPGVMLDFDADGHIVGLEILDATESLGVADLNEIKLASLSSS